MTSKEFFVWTVKDEIPRFERAFQELNKVPEDKWNYRPDPKSRSTEELVRHTFGSEVACIPIFLKTGMIDGAEFEKIMAKSAKEAIDNFTKQLEVVIEVTEGMPETDWDSPAKMTFGGKTVWEANRGQMAWSFLLDLIHHRGQLTVHMRPMGGKVAAIYGPSADYSDM